MKASLSWEKIVWASVIIYSHDGSFPALWIRYWCRYHLGWSYLLILILILIFVDTESDLDIIFAGHIYPWLCSSSLISGNELIWGIRCSCLRRCSSSSSSLRLQVIWGIRWSCRLSLIWFVFCDMWSHPWVCSSSFISGIAVLSLRLQVIWREVMQVKLCDMRFHPGIRCSCLRRCSSSFSSLLLILETASDMRYQMQLQVVWHSSPRHQKLHCSYSCCC